MVNRRGRPSGQSWWTFLRNHVPEIAAMDLFVVPTLAFGLLYGFIIVRLDRRELVWMSVTNSPTADWIARQITEAFPWDSHSRRTSSSVRPDLVFGTHTYARQAGGHFAPKIEINLPAVFYFGGYVTCGIENNVRSSICRAHATEPEQCQSEK